MARKTVVVDDVTVNYKKIHEIVNEVTGKMGTDVVLSETRSTDGFSL